MALPKTGKAGTPVSPADPVAAVAADNAKPGAVDKSAAKPNNKPFKPPKTKAEKKRKSWIEVMLVDEQKNPVAGEAYRITLPDGQTVAEGTLDEKGLVRLEGIDPGTCQVAFPDIDASEWRLG